MAWSVAEKTNSDTKLYEKMGNRQGPAQGFQIRPKCVTPYAEDGIGSFLPEMSVTYFMDIP